MAITKILFILFSILGKDEMMMMHSSAHVEHMIRTPLPHQNCNVFFKVLTFRRRMLPSNYSDWLQAVILLLFVFEGLSFFYYLLLYSSALTGLDWFVSVRRGECNAHANFDKLTTTTKTTTRRATSN